MESFMVVCRSSRGKAFIGFRPVSDYGKEPRKASKTSLLMLESIRGLDSASLTEIAEYTEIPASTLQTHLQTGNGLCDP